MSRILLADDSPHAQRMGELILRDEGYEVVTVTDGETAIVRLADVDPDVILADALLPAKDGYQICRYVKNHPRHRHARVVLTAGALEPLDEAEAARSGADATVRKPFEASVLLETVRRLAEAAVLERPQPEMEIVRLEAAAPEPAAEPVQAAATISSGPEENPHPEVGASGPPHPSCPPDEEELRAAVTLALNEAFAKMADELAEKVIHYLRRS